MTFGCTHCRKRTDVDEIGWFDGMAVCPDCFDELIEKFEREENK